MINIEVIGNLGQDAKAQQLQDGRFLITFSVCENLKSVDKSTGEMKEFPHWFNVSYFTKGEKMKEYLVKGQKVYVSGDFRLDEYVSKQTNTVKESMQITAMRVQILFDKKDDQSK